MIVAYFQCGRCPSLQTATPPSASCNGFFTPAHGKYMCPAVPSSEQIVYMITSLFLSAQQAFCPVSGPAGAGCIRADSPVSGCTAFTQCSRWRVGASSVAVVLLP